MSDNEHFVTGNDRLADALSDPGTRHRVEEIRAQMDEADQPTLIAFDSRGRATLPAKIFKHTKYLVEELPDGALLFIPVPGSERTQEEWKS